MDRSRSARSYEGITFGDPTNEGMEMKIKDVLKEQHKRANEMIQQLEICEEAMTDTQKEMFNVMKEASADMFNLDADADKKFADVEHIAKKLETAQGLLGRLKEEEQQREDELDASRREVIKSLKAEGLSAKAAYKRMKTLIEIAAYGTDDNLKADLKGVRKDIQKIYGVKLNKKGKKRK